MTTRTGRASGTSRLPPRTRDTRRTRGTSAPSPARWGNGLRRRRRTPAGRDTRPPRTGAHGAHRGHSTGTGTASRASPSPVGCSASRAVFASPACDSSSVSPRVSVFGPCTRTVRSFSGVAAASSGLVAAPAAGFGFIRRDVSRLLRLFGRLLGNLRARLARGTLALDLHFTHDLLGLASRRGLALHRPRALRLSPRRRRDRTGDVRVADAEDVTHAEGIGRRGTQVRADGEARPARQQKRQSRAEVPPFPRRLASHRVDARATSMGEPDDRMRTVSTPRGTLPVFVSRKSTLRLQSPLDQLARRRRHASAQGEDARESEGGAGCSGDGDECGRAGRGGGAR